MGRKEDEEVEKSRRRDHGTGEEYESTLKESRGRPGSGWAWRVESRILGVWNEVSGL